MSAEDYPPTKKKKVTDKPTQLEDIYVIHVEGLKTMAKS